MEFVFEVVRRVGSKHQAADGTYGLPTNGSNHTVVENDIPVTVVARSNMQAFNS